MLLAAWFHDLDPFLWELRPGLGVRWYGLSYALGFLIAWLLLRFLCRRGASSIPEDRAADVVVLGAIFVIAGGRLGYVFFYRPELLVEFTAQPPWWGLLAINKGGMASHGAIVAAVVYAWVVSRGFKGEGGGRVGRAPALHVLDTFALLTPVGLLLGRLANFVNGELLGRVAARAGEPAPWWAVKFPQEVLERPGEISQQQLDGIARLAGMRPPIDTPQERIELEIAYSALLRQVQEGAPQLQAQLEPLINARHPSQLYQAAAEGVAVGLVVWVVARRPRKPGVVAACFGIAYGLLRIVTEFYRLPDAHLEVQRWLGLSRGQWLSVAMVLAGVGLLAWALRREAPLLGGWAAARPAPADETRKDPES